jgi:ATP-dependent exoDNAse (exonuclease V) beta subunit
MPRDLRLERRLLVPVDLSRGGLMLLLTDEQQEAIERRDGSLFLHAGAGSGKTRVLVERFVRAVLDDEVRVDRILAITFTEKAAAELKGRLRRRFLELGEREHAREAEAAWVSTIHGFCSRLLRANPLLAGIDPEYRVLDEAGAARLSIDAFDRALEDFVLGARAGADRLDLVASYTPDKLQRMVTTVYSRLRSRGERAPSLPPISRPALSDQRPGLDLAIKAAQAYLGTVPANKTVEAALAQVSRCSKLLDLVPEGALGDPVEFGDTRVKRGNATALRDSVLDSLDEALDAWLAVCAGVRAYDDYVLMAKLLDLYGRRYAGLKEARSALDFDDLELRARDLLRDEPGLRASVRERFSHVMVDEYQDTNPLQNELLDLVSDGNLFTVGDERQSIYGFRNADVDVFRARRDVARADGRDARLAVNFRSRPELIEALNSAFSGVFGDEYAPLAVPEGAPSPSAVPRVELLVVNNKRRCWESFGEDGFGVSMRGIPTWRAAEARLLALRVDQLVQAGECGYGDVAVLLRAASDMGAYERALAERGIPTYATGAGGYWGQQQVADLRSYLAALANPRDDMALYNVLASPLCGASLDALPALRSAARAAGRDPWWALEEAFAAGGDGSEGLTARLPDGSDRERVASFVQRFASERRAAPRMSLETLIDRAVTLSGYDRAVLGLRGGGRRMANVRKLMRLAREFEAERGRDLRGFIDFVDEQEMLAAREGEAPLEGEGLDAVRLMTVHAAKGLEFPVVCVADLGRTGRGDDGALQISTDGRVGLSVASLGGGSFGAMQMDEIKAEAEAAAEEEERRIFYVAMTRAESRLIVSGATDTVAWDAAKPLGAPMDWVWPALSPGARLLFEDAAEGISDGVRCVHLSPETVDEVLPAADRAPAAAASGTSGSAAPAGSDPSAVAGPATPSPAAVNDPPPATAPAFPPLTEAVPLPVARLSYTALESYKRCPYRFYLERVVRMPRAGSSLVIPEAEPEPAPTDQLSLAAPPAAEEGLSPLIRGSIVHELLERVDFRRPRPPSRAEIERRADANRVKLTDEDVADIAGLIDSFLASDLCRRIRAARRARLEMPFAYPLKPDGLDGRCLLVNGIVDVHADEGDRLLVVDYKTDALDGRDPAEVCDEKYSGQRLVYALAGLRAQRFAEVEVAYCFLERPDLVVSRRFTQSDRPDLERDLLDLAAGVIAGQFEPTDRPHRELCESCPGQPALCSWPPDRTLAERPEGETFAAPEPDGPLP